MVRLFGSLFFGVVIPNAAGIVDNSLYSWWQLILIYLYFAITAFAIWQSNRIVLFYVEKRYNWFLDPFQKIIGLLSANVILTSFVVILFVGGWYLVMTPSVNWAVIKITGAICIVCVIFISHSYETVFLIKQRQLDLLNKEKLERAKASAELEALKNQIDPHFMFNSLNSLSYLIEKNPEAARDFTDSLAEIYRYILTSKDQQMVWLSDEIDFLDKYISLLKIRFQNNLTVNRKLISKNYLIPPISIFIAFENVVKHNEISDRKPMWVDISTQGESLVISNRLQPKKKVQESTKIGLENLDERFTILVGKGINKRVSKDVFTIEMPLLKVAS